MDQTPLARVRHVFFDDSFVCFAKHCCAASITKELVAALDHAVAFAGLRSFDTTSRRNLEALLGA